MDNHENIWGIHAMVTDTKNPFLFAGDAAKTRYLHSLCRVHEKNAVPIYAVCCIHDAVHILFGEAGEAELRLFLRKINAGFARYCKFCDNPVRSGKTVLRPLPAPADVRLAFRRLAQLPGAQRCTYKWSSFGYYIGIPWEYSAVLDTDRVFALFGGTAEEIERFCNPNIIIPQGLQENFSPEAVEALCQWIAQFYGIRTCDYPFKEDTIDHLLMDMDRASLMKFMFFLRSKCALTYQAIASLCRFSYGTVHRCIKAQEQKKRI